MNLLGLMLADVLQRRLKRAGPSALERLRGDVVMRAGTMRVTLRFDGRGVEIKRGAVRRPGATVVGSLAALLDVALGRALLSSLLSRRVAVRGNPLLLARVALLLRV